MSNNEKKLVRISMTVPEELLTKFDKFVEDKGYFKRSEALRDAMRVFMTDNLWLEEIEGDIFGSITLIYNHHEFAHPDFLNSIQHDYGSIIRASLHIHISHDECMEIIALEGNVKKVKSLAQKLRRAKGVKTMKLTVAETF